MSLTPKPKLRRYVNLCDIGFLFGLPLLLSTIVFPTSSSFFERPGLSFTYKLAPYPLLKSSGFVVVLFDLRPVFRSQPACGVQKQIG